ncbi:DNA-binding storekeeper protein-related transcriptional regulator [Raphanus sativus]|uniref:Probable transcription factor At1g61730 n=1 Tax=Raphanus sativus TaxID=3726 RepID=A0A6J0M5R0_RAPSA|nr:probable transcription factor At1g61730 [Raphanus sativus]KAJ4902020.1 DNA-binding storekeeper protein-related transcriptional regulator [Raphanus sativus]
MNKKRNPLENPPAASSSDDDEVVDSSAGEEEEHEDDDDASSSEEEEEDQPKPPSSSAVTIPGKTSDSGSETETDSDSDTEQPPNQRSGKGILAKDKSPPPLPKSGTKRPSEETSRETNSKREKKTGEDSKKPAAFQRLWTEDDEISVLQGMIDFKNDTGNSPYDDTNAYYDHMKKFISFEVSKNQFMDKLRSLKKKYMGKEKPSFTKPHDQKSFTLCKFIWGPDGMCLETAVKSNGVSKKKTNSVKQDPSSPNVDDMRVLVHESDWFERSFLVRGIAGFGVDEHFVKQSWRLVPVETKKKVEEKVKMLQAKEIEFVLHKTQILHEVTSMIAEASKNKPL